VLFLYISLGLVPVWLLYVFANVLVLYVLFTIDYILFTLPRISC
jgi:hypothetical protein